MRTAVILTFVFLICSCGTVKRDRFTYSGSEKETWINSYKYEAFYGCMQAGLGNDSLKIILQSKDLFSPNMDMTFVTIDEARLLGKTIVTNMPPAHIKIDTGEEALRKKNYISYVCLNYYASRELDSIAREKYKRLHAAR